VRNPLRAAVGPVTCSVVVTGLLGAWTATGGVGTLTRIRLQVTRAAVPMRAFTPQAAAAVHTATTFRPVVLGIGTTAFASGHIMSRTGQYAWMPVARAVIVAAAL
jgi:hypothetical protein